jgi:hypothetical protein
MQTRKLIAVLVKELKETGTILEKLQQENHFT